MPSMSEPLTEPMVILVHGAWHGGWCWAALQTELDRRGVPSLAPDLPGHGTSGEPLGDLYGDVDAIAALAQRLERPVVMVGHSYGGVVITQAATQVANATELVFVAAFVPDQGESLMGQLGGFEQRRVALGLATRPGATDATLSIDPAGATAAFYHLAPTEVAAAAVARLGEQPAASFTQPVTGAAWRTLPSTYVLCRHDEAIHPDHQAIMAARCAATVSLDADHSPFLTHVAEVADIIEAAWQRAREARS
jgi:pimeloyl-ACP methyl ester carboxylesterase